MRNMYAVDGAKRFFCYFGCATRYATSEQLEKHLMKEHPEDKLKLWGISLPLLERKYCIASSSS
jgi:hypothetical protein